MTLRSRSARAVAVLAIVALGVSACSSGGPSANPDVDDAAGYNPAAKVTITWWTGQTADAETLAEQLAHQYTEQHPNVTIDVSSGASTTDDLLTKLSAGFVSNTYPDISYAYGSWATELGRSGKTQNLTNWVNEPAMAWTEIPAAARTTALVNGHVIGVPALVDNLGLIYNKKLFDAAGLAYPTDSWSWDDFRNAAKQLTDRSRNIYGTAYSVSGSEDTTWHLWPLLWQRGGHILDDKNKPTFNSDAGVGALEFLRAMAVDDKSMYLDQTDEKYAALFRSGNIAMMMSGPWELYDLKDNNVDYGVSFLPGYNGDHETVSGPDLWVLFAHNDPNRAGASRDFIRWLTSKDIDAKWNLANGNLPLRTSESSTPEFQAYVKDYAPGAQKFFDNLANAKQARPTVGGYVEMSRYVGEAIAQVLQGAATAKAALDDAARRSAPALADQ